MVNKFTLGSVETYNHLIIRFGIDESHSHHDTSRSAAPNSQDSVSQLQDSLPKEFLYVEISRKWAPDPHQT